MRNALTLKQDIHWVGALDFDIRVFDIIMRTEYGTTYNAYIIRGSEKTALIEVVKEAFFDEFLERAAEVADIKNIDYIIMNHVEPDHSGSLKKLLALCPNAKVVGSGAAMRFLKEIINEPFDAVVVKDGDTLSLGNMTLRFIMAPFLHWPDTMFTYVPERKTLFTCDVFGCHYCSEKVFNDVIGEDFTDAYTYYFDNIMGPFKDYVLQALDKIKGLDIEAIGNGHGPVIRRNPQKYIDMYRKMATVTPPARKNVVIVYASSYGYTRAMGEKMAEAIQTAGDIDVLLFDIVTADKAEILREIGDAAGILIGSATLVGDALPPILSLLAELNPIIHKGKLAGAFGSYGWSGEAVPNIEQRFTQLKFKMPVPGLKISLKPSDAQMEQALEFGKAFGEAVAQLP